MRIPTKEEIRSDNIKNAIGVVLTIVACYAITTDYYIIGGIIALLVLAAYNDK